MPRTGATLSDRTDTGGTPLSARAPLRYRQTKPDSAASTTRLQSRSAHTRIPRIVPLMLRWSFNLWTVVLTDPVIVANI